jgi:hypothetical protein
VPTFIERDVAMKIFEMGSGLRLLWKCQPEHPLCKVFDVANAPKEHLELRWLSSWGDIHETHDRLNRYAENMWKSMHQTTRETQITKIEGPHIAVESTYFGLFETKEAAEQMLSSRIQEMSLHPKTQPQIPS